MAVVGEGRFGVAGSGAAEEGAYYQAVEDPNSHEVDASFSCLSSVYFGQTVESEAIPLPVEEGRWNRFVV